MTASNIMDAFTLIVAVAMLAAIVRLLVGD